MAKKVRVTETDLRDLWLQKYHNTNTAELIQRHPESVLKSSNWFQLYQVTQEQYDEWKKEAKAMVKQSYKYSKGFIDEQFPWIELQVGPMIKSEDKEVING